MSDPASFVPATTWQKLSSGGVQVTPVLSVPSASFLAPSGGQDGLVGTTDGEVVFLEGSTAKLDGGQNWLMWDAASTLTANNSTVFNPFANVGLPGRWRVAAPALPQTTQSLAAGRLINPALQVDQVNEGGTINLVSGTPAYLADMWRGEYVNAGAVVQAARAADGPQTTPFSARLTVVTGGAVVAGSNLQITTPIEANTLTDAAFGTANARQLVLGFWIKSSIAPYVFSVCLQNAARTRSIVFPLPYTQAGVWTYYAFPIVGDTGGVWITSGTALGVLLSFVAAGGATFQTATPGVWVGGDFRAATFNTNTILSTNGATFAVAQVQLQVAALPTPFQQRDFATELAICQRYFEKSYTPGTAVGTATANGQESVLQQTVSNIVFPIPVRFKVTKRIVPTVHAYSPVTGTVDRISNSNGPADLVAAYNAVGANGMLLSPTSVVGVVGASMSAHWYANALP